MKTDPELIRRYLRMNPAADAGAFMRVQNVCEAMENALLPGYVFRLFPIIKTESGPRLGNDGPLLPGFSAGRMLRGCHSAAVLTATLGFDYERLISTAQKRDMAEAVILDACASAYIEKVADEAETEIVQRCGGYLTDRFSPGYGDLPLSLQPEIIRMTDAEKWLGVHVLDSCLLTPVKTVTALIGISDTPRPALIRGCAYCSLQKNCLYKKGAGPCEAQ